MNIKPVKAPHVEGRLLYSSGSDFERDVGYSRAVVDGEWCFVAGTTGYNYEAMQIAPGGAGAQTRQTLANIAKTLAEAGFDMADIVRLNTIVVNKADVPLVTKELGKVMADIRPANTLMLAGLLNDDMLVEIVATAYRRAPSD